jgi:hypothetical protein
MACSHLTQKSLIVLLMFFTTAVLEKETGHWPQNSDADPDTSEVDQYPCSEFRIQGSLMKYKKILKNK